MRKQIRYARLRKSARRRYYRAYKRCRAPHQCACQEPHKADRARYIASLLGLVIYVLLSIVLAIACIVTQNYMMLPLVNIMAHELGCIVRHMVESTYVLLYNLHSMKSEQKFLDVPKKQVEVIDGSH